MLASQGAKPIPKSSGGGFAREKLGAKEESKSVIDSNVMDDMLAELTASTGGEKKGATVKRRLEKAALFGDAGAARPLAAQVSSQVKHHQPPSATISHSQAPPVTHEPMETETVEETVEEKTVSPSKQPRVVKIKTSSAMPSDQSRVTAEPSTPPSIRPATGQSFYATAAEPSSSPQSSPVGSSAMPPLHENALRFYWLDGGDIPQHAPGSIFLFGKVVNPAGGFSSCCLTVKNVERNLFFQPRPDALGLDGEPTGKPPSMEELYEEVETIMRQHSIKAFKAKPVTRRYGFELSDVPTDPSLYLKVVYSFSDQPLPQLSGRTFVRVFGTKTSALEHFLLKRNLMGPCWLDLKPVDNDPSQISWCRYGVIVNTPKAVQHTADPPPNPSLIVMSLTLRTWLNQKTHSNEVVVVSALVHSSVSMDGPTNEPDHLSGFCAVRQLDGTTFPWDFSSTIQEKKLVIQQCANERALLGFLAAKLHTIDPDVIVAHNFLGFELDVLLHRMSAHKIPHWSKIGRLRRTKMPKMQSGPGGMGDSTWEERQVTLGRLIVDTYLSSKDLVRETQYSLTHLAKVQLDKDRQEVEISTLPNYYQTSQDLIELLRLTEQDAYLALALMFKLMVIPLTHQLTSLAGNLWSHSLTMGRSERNEFLLLHEFHRLKYIVPDKQTKAERDRLAREAAAAVTGEQDDDIAQEPQSHSKRKKPAYAGGLVLEPKKGFYDKFILLLDFNSLYPSIIQEYNICFTTVQRPTPNEDGTMPLADVSQAVTMEQGVLPRVIHTLVDRRRMVKSVLKTETDPLKQGQLDIRQKALKLTANSMYGCLGFSNSRFFARPLAELITTQGRDILQRTVDLANNQMCLEVIYGDSVTGDTALLIRRVGGAVRTVRIDALDGAWAPWGAPGSGKEAFEFPAPGVEVWRDGGFSRIERVIRHAVAPDAELVRVVTHTGLVDCTRDHSLLRPDGARVRPADVRIGDALLHAADDAALLAAVAAGTDDGGSISPAEAFGMGLFAADGSCGAYSYDGDGTKHSWAINNADRGLLERVAPGLGFPARILDTLSSSGVYKLVPVGDIKGVTLRYRALFYNAAREKRIPSMILGAPLATVRAFWDGFYAGDGDRARQTTCRFDQKGKDMCTGMWVLARRLGYAVSINTRADKHDVFQITCSRAAMCKAPTHIKKMHGLGAAPPGTLVYDLQTSDHHFGVGPGALVVHNTDSIMINTGRDDLQEVKEIGNAVKKEVNKLYRLLEIEIDGVYRSMLLLKKKKYAALMLQETPNGLEFKRETKGLDLVRRDWCPLSKEMGKFVLDEIFSAKSRDAIVESIHEYLRETARQISADEIPSRKFIITKSLTKNIEEYGDAKGQPHVQVASQMRAAGRAVRVGEIIPYIVCVIEGAQSPAEKARHPDAVLREKLVIDYRWYLSQQLHPPIARLCQPIEGTDAAALAECLGLDPNTYHRQDAQSQGSQAVAEALLDDTERFRACERLHVKCSNDECNEEYDFPGVYRSMPGAQGIGVKLVCGLPCPKCGTVPPLGHLGNLLALAIRKHQSQYYQSELTCDDSSCAARLRGMPVRGPVCPMPMCGGKLLLEYTYAQLHLQLRYFQSLFDCHAAKEKLGKAKTAQTLTPLSIDEVGMFDDLVAEVNDVMSRCGANWVSLDGLFSWSDDKKTNH